VLQAFHPLVSDRQRRSGRHGAVIRHQKGVVRWNERIELPSERHRPRGFVGNERHPAHLKDNLGEYTRSKPLAGHGEPGRDRRMRMHDGADVGAPLVDAQMHGELARGPASSSHAMAVRAHFHA